MDKYKKLGEASNGDVEIPSGLLPILVERMVQLDDLKALENNTLELWRALARYELQKESEVRQARTAEHRAMTDLQQQNEMLRQQLAVKEAVANVNNSSYGHGRYCSCCHYGCGGGGPSY